MLPSCHPSKSVPVTAASPCPPRPDGDASLTKLFKRIFAGRLSLPRQQSPPPPSISYVIENLRFATAGPAALFPLSAAASHALPPAALSFSARFRFFGGGASPSPPRRLGGFASRGARGAGLAAAPSKSALSSCEARGERMGAGCGGGEGEGRAPAARGQRLPAEFVLPSPAAGPRLLGERRMRQQGGGGGQMRRR